MRSPRSASSPRALGLLLLVLPPLLLSLTVAAVRAADRMPPPSAERVATLSTLLTQDCGSCHGLSRKGGLGPSLTPDAIAGQDDDVLVDTILMGRTGTAMPPWDALLTRSDALWMVGQLRKGVSEK